VKRFHYAWIVVVVTFLTLLAAQAVRAAPVVIISSLLGFIAVALALRISTSAVTRMPRVAFEAARP
jgi:hypothetical protein